MPRWPRPPIRGAIPTVAPGTARMRPPLPMTSVAQELLDSAARAQSRGGIAASAAFLDRAVTFTADAGQRASRALAAARAKFEAADFRAAESLLAAADAGPLDELGRAELQRMRAQVAFDLRRGRDAPAPARLRSHATAAARSGARERDPPSGAHRDDLCRGAGRRTRRRRGHSRRARRRRRPPAASTRATSCWWDWPPASPTATSPPRRCSARRSPGT